MQRSSLGSSRNSKEIDFANEKREMLQKKKNLLEANEKIKFEFDKLFRYWS